MKPEPDQPKLWGIKYPDGSIHQTFRTKQYATMYGSYPAQSWRQAYAKGYRLVRVKIIEIK